jgi:Ca2+-binding RTX toxin-like protein
LNAAAGQTVLDGWDYIEGKPAADELYGGNGSDTLKGTYGNDYLVGGRATMKSKAGRAMTT